MLLICLNRIHICVPPSMQDLFFRCIACLAAGNQIEFFRPPDPGQRDDMIYGQYPNSSGIRLLERHQGPINDRCYSGFRIAVESTR